MVDNRNSVDSRCGMFCNICTERVIEAKHLAFNDEGELITICDPCFDRVKRFFGGNYNGKTKLGRNN